MSGLEKSHSSTLSQAEWLLATARDWQLKVDLGRQLKFPQNIAVTLWPDMVLVSETTRQVVLLELTVPWKDRMEEQGVEDCRPDDCTAEKSSKTSLMRRKKCQDGSGSSREIRGPIKLYLNTSLITLAGLPGQGCLM